MELQKSMWITLFFIIFLFVVSIVLMNLLNALAIADTQKILDEGEITDLAMKIEVLKYYDDVRQTTRVFNKSHTWKIAIDSKSSKIDLARDSCTETYDALMDESIIKKLQKVERETRENRESERIKTKSNERILERMKQIETHLGEIAAKLQK